MFVARCNPSFRCHKRRCFIVTIFLVVFVAFLSLGLSYVWKEHRSNCFPDLSEISTVEGRREAFIDYMTTQVDLRNRRILAQRERLELLMASGGSISEKDRRWLLQLAERYDVVLSDSLAEQDLFMLYYRVDIIPLSLILAITAYESDWGRNGCALRAHNLCGIRCSGTGHDSDSACVRMPGKSEALRAYESTGQCLDAFISDLNTGPLYEDFRWLRARGRFFGEHVGGLTLLRGLVGTNKYMDEAYVSQLRHIILKYKFE